MVRFGQETLSRAGTNHPFQSLGETQVAALRRRGQGHSRVNREQHDESTAEDNPHFQDARQPQRQIDLATGLDPLGFPYSYPSWSHAFHRSVVRSPQPG